VGCEFACLLNAAGAHVTIVELTAGLLPGEDEAVVTALTRSFEQRGISVKTNAKVENLKKLPTGWSFSIGEETIEADQILVCVGRIPSFKSLALEAAGIKAERAILINDRMQTSNPNVYAAGDVAGTRLAHAASAQAEAAASNALGVSKLFEDRFVPRCLYSWPEVASVGQWKYQLEQQNKPVKAVRAFFQGAAKALAANETEGFVQIVLDPGTGRILGAQIIGAHATELIHIFSVALKKEMTVQELSEVMFAHPTLSEVIKDAAKK
jgi:dihydrolipoamide dehydrogenase